MPQVAYPALVEYYGSQKKKQLIMEIDHMSI